MEIVIIGEISEDIEHEYAPIKYHHLGYLLEQISLRHKAILVDWRDIDDGLIVKRGIKIIDKKVSIEELNIEMNQLAEVIFIRQSGPMHIQRKNKVKNPYEESKYLHFLKALQEFKGIITNDPKLLSLAISKEYLLQLQTKGHSIIPTREALTYDELILCVKDLNLFETNEIVLKPKLYSGYGAGVRKLQDFEDEFELESYIEEFKPILVQPLMKQIYTEGEYSLIFLGNELSHGVNKKTGNFLINQDYNPVYIQYFPSEEHYKQAKDILKTIEEIYNCSTDGILRLDFIKKGEQMLLNEIEIINPGLYIKDMNMYSMFAEKFVQYIENLGKRKVQVYES